MIHSNYKRIILKVVLLSFYSFYTFATERKDFNDCEMKYHPKTVIKNKNILLEQSGITETQNENFKIHGELNPGPLKTLEISKLVERLGELKNSNQKDLDNFSMRDLSMSIKNRSSELSIDDRRTLESLIDSDEHVLEIFRILEKIHPLSPSAQLKVVEKLGYSKFSQQAFDVLKYQKIVENETYKMIIQMAKYNARFKLVVSQFEDPQRLLVLLEPKSENKNDLLLEAGLSEIQIQNLFKTHLLNPDITLTMSIDDLIDLYLKMDDNETFLGKDYYQITTIIINRVKELTKEHKEIFPKILELNSKVKIENALRILEKIKGPFHFLTQLKLLQLLRNKDFAERAYDVIKAHKVVDDYIFCEIVKLAKENIEHGIKPRWTEDPERLLLSIEPVTSSKEDSLRSVLSFEEARNFLTTSQIRPHKFRILPISVAIDIFAETENNEKYEDVDINKMGTILLERVSEIGRDELEILENLIFSDNMLKVRNAMRIFTKFESNSPKVQIQAAKLLLNVNTRSEAFDILVNQEYVVPEAFLQIAQIAKNKDAQFDKLEVSLAEKLLSKIFPTDINFDPQNEFSGVTSDQMDSKINDRQMFKEFADQVKTEIIFEEQMQKQREENPALRKGITDISQQKIDELQRNLQKQASSIKLFSKNPLLPRPGKTYRYVMKIGGVFKDNLIMHISTSDKVSYQGRDAYKYTTTLEYSKEDSYKYNLPTVVSENFSSIENENISSWIPSDDGSYHWSSPILGPKNDLTFKAGPLNNLHQWQYIGSFVAPNGIKYKGVWKLRINTSQDSSIDQYYAEGIGYIYSKSGEQITYLEGIL